MRTDFRIEQVKIIEVPDHGDPALIGDSVRRFIKRREAAGLPPQSSATFNIFYGDPNNTLPAHFRVDLCAAIDHDAAPNDPRIVTKVIPGGSCAVLRHIGGDYTFGTALSHLCALWLPQSGRA
jgi:AraC family transcriptional regulator